jgi:hypothetical protein
MPWDPRASRGPAVPAPDRAPAYTRTVVPLARRLTSVAMAVTLSGSPAVLSACMALCVDVPAASASEVPAGGHHGHGDVTEPVAGSPHAHHGIAASTGPTAHAADASPMVPPDARLAGDCDDCCIAGTAALPAGPGVPRTDGQALATTPAVVLAAFQVRARPDQAAPLRPPVPPPSPTRAPLALRI